MMKLCGTAASVLWLDRATPNSTRFAPAVGSAGENSRNIRRQLLAAAAVVGAPPPRAAARIFASCPAYAGVRRVPAGGSEESGADDRTVIMAVPLFTGSL